MLLTEAFGDVRAVCEDSATHVDLDIIAAAVVVEPHGPDHGGDRATDHNLQQVNKSQQITRW